MVWPRSRDREGNAQGGPGVCLSWEVMGFGFWGRKEHVGCVCKEGRILFGVGLGLGDDKIVFIYIGLLVYRLMGFGL